MLRRNLRLKTAAIVTLAVLVILAGVAVGVVRLVDTLTPGYRAELADWAGEQLDQPLTIGQMSLGWSWTGPILQLDDVTLLDEDTGRAVLGLDTLALHFAFWDLARNRIFPDEITLAGPRLAVYRAPDGGLRVSGLAGGGAGSEFEIADAAAFLERIHRIHVQRGELRLTLPKRDAEIQLTAVDLRLTNRGERHRLAVEARLPEAYGERVDLEVFALGPLDALDTLEAHAYLHARGLSVPRLLAAAGIDSGDLHGGHGSAEIWADWNEGRFTGARAALETGAFHRSPARDAAPLAPAMTLNLNARAVAEGIRVQVEELRSAATGLTQARGQLLANPDTGRIQGELLSLPAGIAASWLRLAAPRELARVTAAGEIERLAFDLHRDAPGQARLVVEFSDLAVADAGRGFELGRFDGTFTREAGGGKLRLNGARGGIAWDRYIHGAIPVDAASGEIAWETAEDETALRLTDLHLAGASATVDGGGRIRLPAGGPADVDLAFQLRSNDIAALVGHVPQAPDLPNPRLRDWLPQALPAGRITSARLRLRGPLNRFPFAGGGGEFRVEVEGEGITLAYKPGWPVLSDLRGRFELVGDTLNLRAERGAMLGVAIGPGQAHIPNVREPVLAVNGRVSDADAAAALDFLPNSPLADRFGRLAHVLQVEGQTDLQLDLSVPLKPGLGEIAVAGRIRPLGVDLGHEALPRPIENIGGSLRFDLSGLYAEDLEGEFAGLPIRADLAPAEGDALRLDVRAPMRLPEAADSLADLLPAALLERASGETVWHAALTVLPDGRASDLALSSDLAGMALDLPAPLGKPAAPAAPIRLALTPNRDRVTLDYADRVAATVTLADGAMQSANVLFGGADVEPTHGPGLWLGGILPVVDISAWRRLIATFDPGGGPGLALRGADVQAAGLRMDGRRIDALAVRVTPLTADDGWLAQISGAGAAGRILWLQETDGTRIEANLKRLALNVAPSDAQPTGDRNDRPLDPATLPALHLTVDKLRVEDDELGRLEIETAAVPDGLRLHSLSLNGGDRVRLRGQGGWTRKAGVTEAEIGGRFTGDGISRLLEALGYTATLKANKADITGNLKVAPNPNGLQADTLNGKLRFNIENGTLVALEPGAGRVLGLVNFYALPRRLLLDFRDVLGQGMAFDSLSGDFRIENGNARTDNLRIDTPSAVVRIRGRVGLAARDYDQRVTIVPKVSSAATIAGTMLGGPAVGAAVFVAQRLLRKPIADISTVTYRLTGSWEDPQIEPMETPEDPKSD